MKRPRIITMAVKETRHIIRDPRSLTLVFVLPVFMILLYGYAVNLDIRHVQLALVDFDRGELSREMTRRMSASEFFEFTGTYNRVEQARREVLEGRAFGILVFPAGFSEDAYKSGGQAQLLLDGSDPNTATIIQGYFNSFVERFNLSLSGGKAPFEVRPRILYNPDLESKIFIVPGLAGVLLMMVCALMTSVTITREKETGSLELMLTTPIHAYQVILGKVLPYVAIAFAEALVIVAVSHFWFEVPVRGSLLVLLVMTLGYVFCALALGIAISASVATQQVAMSIALVGTMLPSVILSGFIFPISSMPLPLQTISRAIPATYYLRIIRGVMLKDVGWAELWPELATMMGIGTVIMLIGMKKFATRMK
jgi:ABC-2 type transport system permease protein